MQGEELFRHLTVIAREQSQQAHHQREQTIQQLQQERVAREALEAERVLLQQRLDVQQSASRDAQAECDRLQVENLALRQELLRTQRAVPASQTALAAQAAPTHWQGIALNQSIQNLAQPYHPAIRRIVRSELGVQIARVARVRRGSAVRARSQHVVFMIRAFSQDGSVTIVQSHSFEQVWSDQAIVSNIAGFLFEI